MANGYLVPRRRGSLAGTGFPAGRSIFDLHRQVNRLFDDLFEQGPLAPLASGLTPGAAGTGWPPLEVDQQDDRIRVVAELPGVEEKDIELSVEDGVLSLSGEKRSERTEENGYSERSYGRFERRIALPANVDEENCTAEFRNGVLTVTLPRAEEKARGRRIPLGGGSTQRLEAQNDPAEAPRQQAAEESGAGGQQR